MNPHFAEMLKALSDEGVEHLVIGAHALAAHGYVRATLDIDIWVRPSAEKPRPNPRGPLLRDARRDLLAAARGFGLDAVSDARCAGGPDRAPRPSSCRLGQGADLLFEGELLVDGHACLASLWSGRFDGQGPAAHLVVLDRDKMANNVRFDARPDAFESVPELWTGPT